MSKNLIIPVNEDLTELKKMLKKAKPIFVPRIKMLIEMRKEGDKGISKRELMARIGAGSQTIQNWRTSYKTGGIVCLLSHNRKGFKPSVFTEQEHQELFKILHNPQNELTGFVELKEWIKIKFNKDIKYNTLLKYCVLNFGAKTKVARKSHINKDDSKVEDFKKTLIASVEKQSKK